jgi:isocitrate dehydrogenase
MGIANPSGLLNAAIMMLDHIGQPEVAQRLHNAWLRTIEDGVHTADIAKRAVGDTKYVSTDAFAHAVANRLGQEPRTLPAAVHMATQKMQDREQASAIRPTNALVGVDVFLDWDEQGRDPEVLGTALEQLSGPDGLTLKMITNRGTKVYPDGHPETFCTDHWRCRYLGVDGGVISHTDVLKLLVRLESASLDFIKTEHLYTFDGERGYSLGQGE